MLKGILGLPTRVWRIKPVRIVCLALVALIILIELTPFLLRSLQGNYDLGAIKQLVTPTANDLRQKLRFDDTQKAWVFNADAASELPGVSSDSAKIGGLTYSAKLPMDMDVKTGLTMTDAAAKLDMTMTPQFGLGQGKATEGYVMYPIAGSDAQLIYTFERGGVKEDIILHRSPGNSASFTYDLQLPDSLEARMQDDGSVGIFGGSRTLFGNISYGSDKDRELVEKARKNSKKDTLYYVIPAPVISGDKKKTARANFLLKGTRLTIKVTGLREAAYPLSIDPSFVMDTNVPCSWEQGNLEDSHINLSGCQISRSAISGGTMNAWTQSSGNPAPGGTGVNTMSGTYWNGRYYTLVNSGNATISYATVNTTNGDVPGSWTSVSPPAGPVSRYQGIVAYNGYLYLVGGTDDFFNAQTATYYAKINSNGSLGSWNTATSLNVGRSGNGYSNLVAAYNGRIYITNGCTGLGCGGSGDIKTTEYATINGDGSLGSWTLTTSTNNDHHRGFAGAYNGYIYAVSGVSTSIEYARIKADGSLDTWVVSDTTVPGGVGTFANGHIYSWAGGTSVQIVPIYTNGTLGTAQTASVASPSNTSGATEPLLSDGHGHLTILDKTATHYTSVKPPGDISPFATESDTMPTTNNGINSAATVFYGGYIYILGGNDKDSASSTNLVRYAKLNSDGSTGAWATTSTFSDARQSMGAAAYNGYMYIAGGNRNGNTANCIDTGGLGTSYCRDIQYARICDGLITTNGCSAGAANVGKLGTWASAGGAYAGTGNTGRGGLGMAMYGGYVYVLGGNYNNNSDTSSEVDVAPINADGTVGTWVQNAGVIPPNGRSNFQLAQMGKYLYIAGSRQSPGGNTTNDVIYATLSANGGITNFASAGANFTGARAFSVTAAANGYLYISTGEASWYDDVQYAKINPTTGQLSGGWTTSPVKVPSGRANAMGGIYNGYLYVIGGCMSWTLGICNGPQNTLQYAQIYNGGGGAATSWTNTGTTDLPQPRRHHGTVAYNGYLYAFGGVDHNNSWHTDGYFAPITATGNGAWTSLPTNYDTCNNDQSVSYLAYNSYMYKIGGNCGGNPPPRNDVQFAPINSDGTLGTWKYTWNNTSGATQGGGLINSRFNAGAVAYNGRMYVSGGCTSNNLLNNCLAITDTVETATINADGTVGPWSTTPTNLPSSRWTHRMTAYNGYLYVIGGCEAVVSNNCSSHTARVDYARMNSGGLDGDAGCGTMWCRGTDIPVAVRSMAAYGYNGYLYVIGGQNASGDHVDTTASAPIYSNGMLGIWSTSPERLPAGRSGIGTGAAYNGRFYVIGGCISASNCNGGATASVLQGGPQSTNQIARHSILLTTDARTLPANFFGTFAPQNLDSSINVSTATANDPAVVLNNLGTKSGVVSTTKYSIAPSNDGTKYYWLNFTLDDTRTFTWGETLTPSTISYFQLNYHPNPGMRLRGGKMFNSNTQQSLDAP